MEANRRSRSRAENDQRAREARRNDEEVLRRLAVLAVAGNPPERFRLVLVRGGAEASEAREAPRHH
jgi:hypothetical protein